MRTTARNGFLTLVLILIAVWAVLPHDALPAGFPRIGKISLGKDLAGGVSLVYPVEVRPGEQASDVIPRVIDVLKDRIDPTGQMEISLVQQGNDRIEITMPLPSDRVKRLRGEVEEALAALDTGWVSDDEFERALRLPPEEREAAIAQMVGGDAARGALITQAAAAADAATAARAAYDAQREKVEAAQAQVDAMLALPEDQQNTQLLELLRSALVTEEQKLDAPAAEAARANIAYEQARDAALSGTVSPVEVRRALRLADQPMRLKDRQTGRVVELPSPRDRAITRLKEAHPGAEAAIDRVLAAWEVYESERSTLDDPADLKRILRGAGVLHFRITVNPNELADEAALREKLREVGPRNAGSEQAAWYKINKIENWYSEVAELEALSQDPAAYFSSRGYVVEEWDGEYWMLAFRTPGMQLTEAEGEWGLEGAFPSADEIGRPAISFAMDTLGGQKLGRLTERNIGRQMAVLLDDEVYTAPNLLGRISNSGQITGSFSDEELRYIIRVLSAGSLQAKLGAEPISENVLGPSLGADNLAKGLNAGIVSFILVAAFMVFYYFLCGGVTVIALGVNSLLLVGAMSLQHAAFTLPGIAGIALTFGIAVDANVLVYERIREELLRGADVRTAVRLGYQRALSAIVDGNLTNLIVCVVLGFMGTPEIRGFAITLGVGVLTTLFSQLVLTRTIFAFLTDSVRIRKLRMLPMVFPAVERALTPRIDWIKLRWFFVALSIGWAGLGVIMIGVQGENLLDTEFRGGTAVAVRLKNDDAGRPMTLERGEVEQRISEAVRESGDPSIAELARPSILVINPEADGFTSNQFQIKTVVDNREDRVQRLITAALGDMIDSQPALEFAGSDAQSFREAPVFPVLNSVLGENIDRPEFRNDVSDMMGGVAIVLQGITPPQSVESLETRLAQLRSEPEYAETLSRSVRVVVLEGSRDQVQSAAVLVRDADISFLGDEGRWNDELASREWTLVRDALTETTTLASVQSFSPAMAATFRAQAIVSVLLATVLIVIYVWVRFNSLRFSVAAMLATLHDCLVAVGMVAIAGVLYNNSATNGIARSLGLMPFKFDLNLVAAVLTILGYSLNDTVVIMDRIRENRGKLPYISREVVNLSINQTFSRTVITTGTTLVSVLVLYTLGGPGVREFAYALLIGIIAGTYSSFGVAAPMVWSGPRTPGSGTEAETAGRGLSMPAGGNGDALPTAATPVGR